MFTGIADVDFPSNPIPAIRILNLLMHILTTVVNLCCRRIGGGVIVFGFSNLNEIDTTRTVVVILVSVASASIDILVCKRAVGNICIIDGKEPAIGTGHTHSLPKIEREVPHICS